MRTPFWQLRATGCTVLTLHRVSSIVARLDHMSCSKRANGVGEELSARTPSHDAHPLDDESPSRPGTDQRDRSMASSCCCWSMVFSESTPVDSSIHSADTLVPGQGPHVTCSHNPFSVKSKRKEVLIGARGCVQQTGLFDLFLFVCRSASVASRSA